MRPLALALAAVLAMHAVYWLVIHPVNKVWLRDLPLDGAGERFFAAGGTLSGRRADDDDWEALRRRWEMAHVARAHLGMIGP